MSFVRICGQRLTRRETAALNALIEAAVARRLANEIPEGSGTAREAPAAASSGAAPSSPSETPHAPPPDAHALGVGEPAAERSRSGFAPRPALIDLTHAPSAMEVRFGRRERG